jgi:hypothetical protein
MPTQGNRAQLQRRADPQAVLARSPHAGADAGFSETGMEDCRVAPNVLIGDRHGEFRICGRRNGATTI